MSTKYSNPFSILSVDDDEEVEEKNLQVEEKPVTIDVEPLEKLTSVVVEESGVFDTRKWDLGHDQKRPVAFRSVFSTYAFKDEDTFAKFHRPKSKSIDEEFPRLHGLHRPTTPPFGEGPLLPTLAERIRNAVETDHTKTYTLLSTIPLFLNFGPIIQKKN